MSNKIIFQFEELEHQKKAVETTVKLFKNAPISYDDSIQDKIGIMDRIRNPIMTIGTRVAENLKELQKENKIYLRNTLEENSPFTIEMETGTGKTYVYLRTILELYKEYELKKFMIFIPSIAIRKGVEKSIEQLRNHFKGLYGIDITKHSFVYDSNSISTLDAKLIQGNDLSICIMNVQNFNSNRTKLNTETEVGRVLWDDLKGLKVVSIIDEPQRMEGEKTLKKLEELNSLFTLSYSATHKNLHNQIYKLDSYDAYKQNLVKRIKVKTIDGIIPKDYPYIRYIKFTNDLKAKIRIFSKKQGEIIKFKTFDVLGGASLEELSGGLIQYKDMYIAENPNKLNPLKIASGSDTIYLNLNESTSKTEDKDIIKLQIRLAIKNHFEKQIEILENGEKIKGLTLFFIDKVINVRNVDEVDGRGEYLKIFDEEYVKYIKQNKEKIEKYKEYFPNYENVLNVREGYFARDAKHNIIEVESDISKENIKDKEEVTRGISLILEKKEELLSFNESLAFIFSHSALREGWDNPNIFTLCTLKSGNSQIAKKQEIGRGLRLPVNNLGVRCYDKKINELTVIANDSYENFAENLQSDYNEGINTNEVSADIIILTLEKIGITDDEINSLDLINTLYGELKSKKIIDKNNLLTRDREYIVAELESLTFKNDIFNKHSEAIKKNLVIFMMEKGTKRIEIINGDNPSYHNKVRNFVNEETFMNIYMDLYEKLSKKTYYNFKIDSDEFIKICIDQINELLKNKSLKKIAKVIESVDNWKDISKKMELSIKNKKDINLDNEFSTIKRTDMEIISDIMNNTRLPRMIIINILLGIEQRDLLNSQELLDLTIQKIKELLNNEKAKGITSYEVIEGYKLEAGDIFELDSITEEDFEKSWRIFKAKEGRSNSLNEYYKMDSEGESEFAKKLEANENILLFTKLKKGGFTIDTPFGKYSPDWAIFYKSSEEKDDNIGMYFIVETKAEKNINDLTEVEKIKIKCGKLHFKAVSNSIKFDWVKNYDDFKNKFGVKESL